MRPVGTMAPLFRYWLDPVCLTAALLYAANRLLIRPGHVPVLSTGVAGLLVRGYLNDLLCVPLFLPPVLLIYRGMGLRRHDRRPLAWEVLLHLVIWSVYFEAVAPRLTSVYRTTADPLDVAAYAIGALAAGLYWGTWRFGRPSRIGWVGLNRAGALTVGS